MWNNKTVFAHVLLSMFRGTKLKKFEKLVVNCDIFKFVHAMINYDDP